MLARQGKFQPTGRTAAFKAARPQRSKAGRRQCRWIDATAGLSEGQRLDEDQAGEGVGDDGLAAAGAANPVSKIFNFVFEAPGGASLFGDGNPLLSLRSLERDDLSGPGRFRHGQPQLPLAGDVQHAVVVFDHVAQGLQVALDEAGDDLAFEAAVLALLDDPLADDEFH